MSTGAMGPALAEQNAVPPHCPSAQPTEEGSFAFGVVAGSVGAPEVNYLPERVPITEDLLALAGPVRPAEVFRFAAPCATNRCKHFDGHECQLVTKIVQLKPAVTQALPACVLRPDCRWWKQEGKSACMRCPAVRTESYLATEEHQYASNPDNPPL